MITLLSFSIPAYASTVRSGQVSATAKVGQYSLSLSGIIAPFASVILWQGDTALRTTVANAQGQFFFTDVAINTQLTQFCLQAIDVKRLGDSYTCIDVPPTTNGIISKDGIFLPPTLGLVATQINVGDQAVAWGYSMPNAKVTVYISGKPYSTTADSTGFYKIKVKMDSSGTFQLFADATYQSQTSLRPDRQKTLTVFSLPQIVGNTGKTFLEWLWNLLTSTPLGPLLIGFPFIILIIILIAKLKPEWFTWISKLGERIRIWLMRFSRKLHHAWFIGY